MIDRVWTRSLMAAAACLLLLGSGATWAATNQNFAYSGDIDFILFEAPGYSGQFSGSSVGDLVNGFFNYGLNDSDAVVTPHLDNETDYLFSGAPYEAQINVGATPTGIDQAVVVVSDNTLMTAGGLNELSQLAGTTVNEGDQFDAWTARAEDSVGHIAFGVTFFSLSDLNWFTNQLYTSRPPATPADVVAFLVQETNTSGDIIFMAMGEVDSFTFDPVPIPAAAWLFGSGLVGLVGIARRKKTT